MADDQTDNALLSTGQGAMQGAAAGSVVPGIGTAAGAIIGGGLSLAGSLMGSHAASKAAKAQQAAAKQYQQYVQQQTNTATNLIGTPAQMAAHDQALQSQERQVQRQEELAKSINPALIEAGKNLKGLLDGSAQAPALKNLANQRALQRQQLIQSLHEQLGPGAETSSAGQQALQHFDSETANQTSGAQQQYTQMLLGSSLQAPGAMSAVGGANMQLSGINAQDPNIMKAQTMMQGIGMGAGANQNVFNTAGAGSIGSALQGQALVGLGSNLIQGAATMYGKGSLGQDKTTTPITNKVTPGAPAGSLGNAIDPNSLSNFHNNNLGQAGTMAT